jgi:putative peptidoglycan lipid II flippase
MVINAIVAIGLWPALGWLSPAIATVISSWAMVGLLHISSRAFGDVARVKSETISKIGRVAIASIAMGVVLGAAQFSAGGFFTNGVTQFIWALILVALGATAYIIFARLCGAFHLSEIRSAMRRK